MSKFRRIGPRTLPAADAAEEKVARKADTEAARVCEERMRLTANTLAWKLPFFAPATARVFFRADYRRPTACVDLRGCVRGNPDFIKTLSELQLRFVIAHELLHLMLLHHDRRGGRKPFKWNRATDRIINLTLKRIAESAGTDSIEAPPDLLYAEDGQAEWTAEQLYQEEEDWPEDDMVYDPAQVPVGQGCGPIPAEGPGDGENDEDKDDGEGLPFADDDTLRREWRKVAAQAQLQGRQAGSVEGNMLADLLDVPPPKVRWSDVLRGQLYHALAEAGRDDTTWNRRSRRSTAEIILPGGTTYKCKATVVIDTSGSMSDEDLSRAVAETAAIVNHTGVPVFLVVHDWAVQEACWIRPGGRSQVHAQIKKRMKGRGGTSFDQAYARVDAEGTKFNVGVHLTDGEVGQWPSKPRAAKKWVAALLGSMNKAEVPSGMRIIEVEL